MPDGNTKLQQKAIKQETLDRAKSYIIISSSITNNLVRNIMAGGMPFTTALLHGVFVSRHRPRPWNPRVHLTDFVDIMLACTGLTCKELYAIVDAESTYWASLPSDDQSFMELFRKELPRVK